MSNLFNAAVFETDLDGNILSGDDVPFWFRDIIDRAFATSGIRATRKVASHEAIASLEDTEAEGDNCPICYEPYVADQNKKMKMDPHDVTAQLRLDELVEGLAPYGVDVASQNIQRLFRDPALYMPVDMAGHDPLRFPQRNLYTHERATASELFPGSERRSTRTVDPDTCAHTPVKMPNCNHVFGKPCIIEWLNGHVSCPLCRKEVEAVKDSTPDAAKAATLRRNCTFAHTDNPDEMLDHLLRRLTDMFNPARRPFNPFVTPLTDASVQQNWALPTYPEHLRPDRPQTRDPHLTMARKFPLLTLGSSLRRAPFTRLFREE